MAFQSASQSGTALNLLPYRPYLPAGFGFQSASQSGTALNERISFGKSSKKSNNDEVSIRFPKRNSAEPPTLKEGDYVFEVSIRFPKRNSAEPESCPYSRPRSVSIRFPKRNSAELAVICLVPAAAAFQSASQSGTALNS